MNKYKMTGLMFLVSAILPATAWAGGLAVVSNGCALKENATLSMNFNGYEHTPEAVKSKLDAKLEEIKSLAKEAQLTKFEVQSSNYSINYNEGSGTDTPYQYNGNFGFLAEPADQAIALMVTLGKKGYHPSVSVSSYRNGGNCNQ